MQEQLDRMEVKLAELEGKLDATFSAADKTRKYILWGFIITVAAIVVPLVILPFFIPSFLASQGVGTGF
ncbi:MAG: hypothetical protein KGI70_02785 [Patescibacteria group bacterium]|nr:hypothetical protein [Patescibacteria group bacterium]